MSERVRILDQNRNDTGIRRERDDLQEGDYIEIVHLCVRSPEGRHLLQQRNASKKLFPLAWDCAAAGAVKENESTEEAALRELEEELGVRASKEDLQYLFTATFPQGFDDYFLLIVEENTPLMILEEEVSRTGWFTTEEVLSFMEEGLFSEHEGSYAMQERLREELFSDLTGHPLIHMAFSPSAKRLILMGENETLVFERAVHLHGAFQTEGMILNYLTCRLDGRRQHWSLCFSQGTVEVNCSRVRRAQNADLCPVCGDEVKKGAIYANEQINWTPSGSKVGTFTKFTKWSMGKEDIKLADYFLRELARFPLSYCDHCKMYVTEKKK